MDTRELASIIAGGESQTVEFKESFGEESLETLAAFANTTGGTLLVVGATWDEVEEPRAKLADIDSRTLAAFRAECNAKGRRPVPPRDSGSAVLEKLGLLKKGRLLRAALLLFGKNPQAFFPSAMLKIGRFRPGGIIADDREIHGTIFNQIAAAMEYFRGHLQTRFERKGLPARGVIWEYPLAALREAVTNAVCHRDYVDLSQTQIRWLDDRIIVVNPGKLIPPLKAETLLMPHISRQRNRKIAEMLYYAGLVERWGSGTLEMRRSCINAGLPEPAFSEEQRAIWVSFANSKAIGSTTEKAGDRVGEKVGDRGGEKVGVNLSSKQEAILRILVKERYISAREIAMEIGISTRKTEKNIALLRDKGLRYFVNIFAVKTCNF